jgi:putative ABC transport system permease protein
MDGPLVVGPWGLAGAASLLVLNGALSIWLGLGIEKRVAVGALRTTVQLLLLGFVLVPIFGWKNPWLVGAWCLAMVGGAAYEAQRRSKRTVRGLGRSTFISLLLGGGLCAVLGAGVFVGVKPWWEPRYLIPLLGMVLGNSMTGIALGVDRCLAELDEGAEKVEFAIAFGANYWEAVRPVASESIRTALIPILNTMAVVGLVQIPGMMTGQILGGTAPDLAARYQILIIFLIAAATALAAAGTILAVLRLSFDELGRLRRERIVVRT